MGGGLSGEPGALIISLFVSTFGGAIWFVRRRMGVEIDEVTDELVLHTGAAGDPERIAVPDSVLRVPRPRVVLSFAGSPEVEVRRSDGLFRPCPLLYQGRWIRSRRLDRFAAACERRGARVIRG